MSKKRNDSFDVHSLPKDLQEIYKKQVNSEHRSIVDKLLSLREREEYNEAVRPRPPYSDGSVDKMMFPIQPKAKDLMLRILNGWGYIYVLEGGARGGKDVFGLLVWTIYLMTTPHKTHLALGKSLEHALLTILHSSGFGLYYTIPNGTFVRNSDSGAQRGIYKFKDIYGVEKEILFYGNEKTTDHEKYQGFSIGSTYVNEGMTQHLDGINQAIQRMAAAHNHLMLITQNPKGQANPFYTIFEKERMMTTDELDLVDYIKNVHGFEFQEREAEALAEAEKDKKEFTKRFCQMKKVPAPHFLGEEDHAQLLIGLRDIDFHYDKIVSGWVIQDFYKKLKPEHTLYDRSMKKVVGFERHGNNPNGVVNAYNYNYYHFTVDDNLGLTDMQRSEYKKEFKKGSALYLQKTLGIRKTAEKAVYKEFTHKNIIDCDIHDFDKSHDTLRAISIDVGLNHETALLDAEIDYRTGTVYVLQESILDYKGETGTIEDIEDAYWNLVRSRKNRRMPDMTIIDPSHLATINHFISRGIHVTPANNSSLMVRKKEKIYANMNQPRDILGIDLLKYGFDIKKILVHYACYTLISQTESNEFEWNETTGRQVIKKVNDDAIDALRYLINTAIGGTQYWTNEREGGDTDGSEDDLGGVPGNAGTQDEKWNLDKILEEAQRQLNAEIGGDAIFGKRNDTLEKLEGHGYDITDPDWFGKWN